MTLNQLMKTNQVSFCLDEEDPEQSASSSGAPAPLQITYSVSTEIVFDNGKQQFSSVLFLKRGPVVEAEKPVAAQLKIMTLEDPTITPYETLHNYVSNAFAPFFKSYIRATGKADRLGFVGFQI